MTWHGEKWPPSGAGRPGQQRAAARGGLSSFSSPPLSLPAALPAADPRPVGGEVEGGVGAKLEKRTRSFEAFLPERSFVE